MNSSISQHQKSTTCGSSSGLLSSLLLLSLAQLRSRYSILTLPVRREALRGRVALEEVSKRQLVGLGFGMVGVASVYAYLLFPESARDYSWYYVNTYYFLFSLRLWFALIFISTACFLFAPVKYKSIWVVYALSVGIGFAGVLHYSFFVNSHETYHSFPSWYLIIFALSLGVGFIKAADYLCYRKYHLKDGNAARIMGIFSVDQLSWDEKKKHFEALKIEMEGYNERV